MVQTGLEDLVAQYGDTEGNSQIKSDGLQYSRQVVVLPHMDVSNPIPKTFLGPFGPTDLFVWYNVRPLHLSPPMPGRPYSTETLFDASPVGPDFRTLMWAEENLKSDPNELAADLRKNRERLGQRISRTPLPVAIAVSESDSGALPPGHPATGAQKPVMIVFGNANWVSNDEIQSKNKLNLFTVCVAWLRERPEIGTQPSPPKRPTYEFNVTEDQQARMGWLPGFLIVVTIISLSLGVWLVRRR
jgi:hypothetical protein